MKKCRYCYELKLESEFEIHKTIGLTAYRRHRCRACKNKLQSKRIGKLRSWFLEIKKNSACERCGISDSRVLVFHHKDPKTKLFSLGDGASTGSSKKVLLAEIGKCEVLCANCHAIEHYRDVAQG